MVSASVEVLAREVDERPDVLHFRKAPTYPTYPTEPPYPTYPTYPTYPSSVAERPERPAFAVNYAPMGSLSGGGGSYAKAKPAGYAPAKPVNVYYTEGESGPTLRADVELKGEEGLFAAVARNDVAKVREFVEQKVNVNAKNDKGETPLHLAVLDPAKMEIVKALVLPPAKARVNERAKDGRTPMHYAAEAGNLEAVKFLFAHKGRLDVLDARGATPLVYAAGNGHKKVVDFIVEVYEGKQTAKRLKASFEK